MKPFQLDLLFVCFFLFSQGRSPARRPELPGRVGWGGGWRGAGGWGQESGGRLRKLAPILASEMRRRGFCAFANATEWSCLFSFCKEGLWEG